MSGGAHTIAMYLRLSLDDGLGESESITGQRDLISDYLSSRSEFNGNKILEFVDDGWSGTDFNRPAAKEMLDMVRRGDIQCIVVKDFSRFGRNYIEVGDYLEQIFPFLGVRFISVNNNFDSQKQPYSAGSLDVSFKNLVNELYSKDISKKVKAAKYAKMKNGELMSGCPPYGYTISKERKNRLAVDPIAATTIRRIFDLYTSGMNTAAIAAILNAEQIPTRAEHLKNMGYKGPSSSANFWAQETVCVMLRDETYIGTFMAKQTKVAKVGSSKRIPMPREDWIILPDNHEAIVTQEVFELAQARLGEKNSVKRVKHTHLFSCKIICGHCRLTLRRCDPKTQAAYFICTSSRYVECGCSSDKLLESELSDTVLYAIRNQADIALRADAILTDLRAMTNETAQKLLRDTAVLQASADNLKQSKIQLYERYKASELSKDMFLTEREQIEQEISGINAQIADNQNKLEQSHTDDEENQFVQQFKGFANALCLTQSIVQALVSAIYVYDPDSIEIVWNFNDDLERMVRLIEKAANL